MLIQTSRTCKVHRWRDKLNFPLRSATTILDMRGGSFAITNYRFWQTKLISVIHSEEFLCLFSSAGDCCRSRGLNCAGDSKTFRKFLKVEGSFAGLENNRLNRKSVKHSKINSIREFVIKNISLHHWWADIISSDVVQTEKTIKFLPEPRWLVLCSLALLLIVKWSYSGFKGVASLGKFNELWPRLSHKAALCWINENGF